MTLIVLAGVSLARAQSFTVTSQTRTGVAAPTYFWTPLTVAGSGGSYVTDPTADQQTGQPEDDLIGSGTNPGFFVKYGQIGGVDSVAFRLVEEKAYLNNQSVPTFTGGVYVGIDTNGDGALDIVVSAVGKSQGNGINYQNPGPGANVSPSTTSLGNLINLSAFTSTNFDYQVLDGTSATSVSRYAGYTQVGATADAILTFAVTLAQLNSGLTALGKATVNSTTMMRFIAFTSQQGNAINQDVYGPNGISTAVRFDSGGGFTEYTDLTGKPVPEPATAVLAGVAFAGVLVLRWHRHRRAAVSSRAGGGGDLKTTTV